MNGIVCGGSVCPICGRDTWVGFGPCPECCESHERTGRFLRRVRESCHGETLAPRQETNNGGSVPPGVDE